MVILKPFTLDNAQIHHQWNNDPELNYYDSERPHELESYKDFVNRIKKVIDARNKRAELFEIHLKDPQKLIGIADIHDIDRHNNKCWIDCTIGDREYRHDPYLEIDALHKTLQYCFTFLKMHKVCTYAFDFNRTWIDNVEEVGFKQEGQLRSHILKDNEYHSKFLFGLLRNEYAEARDLWNERISEMTS